MGREMGMGREMCLGKKINLERDMCWAGRWVAWGSGEMVDALWEGHRLLKTRVLKDSHTHRHTKVKSVYPPVSLRSLD